MKKLLVVLLATAMVLTLTVASMAAVTISGNVTTQIDFNATTVSTTKEKASIEDNQLNFQDVVNDKLTYNLNLKYRNDKGYTQSAALKSQAPLWANEFYADMKTSFGGLRVGMWEVRFYTTQIFDTMDQTFGKFKSPTTIMWTAPTFVDGVILKTVYMRTNNTTGDWDASWSASGWPTADNGANGDGAYFVTLGYAADNWGITYNYIQDQSNLNGLGGTGKAGYMINVFAQPMDNLKVYADLGQNNDKLVPATGSFKKSIVGAQLNVGQWYGIYEYNFEKTTSAAGTFNQYGHIVGYKFNNSTRFGTGCNHITPGTHAESINTPPGLRVMISQFIFGGTQTRMTCVFAILGLIYQILRMFNP